MDKEKAIFIETRLRQIIVDMRDSVMENIRLEISEAKQVIAEYLDYLSKEGDEFEFTVPIAGVRPATVEKIRSDYKAGKDFGESLDDITYTEIAEFLGIGGLRMASFRERYSNAFKVWTSDEDQRLEKMWCEGMSYKDLSDAFGRNENAIKIRVVRLELEKKYGERPEGPLDVKVRY